MISLIILITLYIVWGVISVRDWLKDAEDFLRLTSATAFFVFTFLFILFHLLINALAYLNTV